MKQARRQRAEAVIDTMVPLSRNPQEDALNDDGHEEEWKRLQCALERTAGSNWKQSTIREGEQKKKKKEKKEKKI